MLLALDTSAAVTVALHDGTAVVASRSTYDPRRHAELLVPMIDEVMTESGITKPELTAIAVGRGPGPFTGLRVGLVTARTLALALGLEVHGVTSLDAVALQAVDAGIATVGTDFIVATDARRREVYWARYHATETSSGLWAVPVTQPDVSRPHELPLNNLPCAGRGTLLYPDSLPPSPIETVAALRDPSAEAIARIALAETADGRRPRDPEPLYLRRPDAAEPGGAKSVLTGRAGSRTP